MNIEIIKRNTAPVAIGGVGGSGTRLFSQILAKFGYNFGQDLNESYDNLWYTLLFKRVELLSQPENEFNKIIDIFISALFNKTHLFKFNKLSKIQLQIVNDIVSDGRDYQNIEWLRQRSHGLINNKAQLSLASKWGWKEPNTHIFLKQFKQSIPQLKYIHVIRNGLDMAFSSNQNQLKLWGKHKTPNRTQITPSNSLNFWCHVHKELFEFTKTMDNDFLLINYDEFCIDPDKGISGLSKFLDIDNKQINQSQILNLISPPQSIGRHKNQNLNAFCSNDIEYVKQLGFKVEL